MQICTCYIYVHILKFMEASAPTPQFVLAQAAPVRGGQRAGTEGRWEEKLGPNPPSDPRTHPPPPSDGGGTLVTLLQYGGQTGL